MKNMRKNYERGQYETLHPTQPVLYPRQLHWSEIRYEKNNPTIKPIRTRTTKRNGGNPMNQLNQELKAVQNSKRILVKELNNTTDPHIREKLQHYINGYSKEETRILQQLNLQLKDITLTEEEDDNQ